ncbi:MAG: hypothetical protein PHY48_04845 [Candidatus Cloacimonetes bacterium]|jgi:RNA polymerase sigma factor (sigma-70 family)|nr:hypothetical protein [Candidatus Cloacimonadota bacterium]
MQESTYQFGPSANTNKFLSNATKRIGELRNSKISQRDRIQDLVIQFQNGDETVFDELLLLVSKLLASIIYKKRDNCLKLGMSFDDIFAELRSKMYVKYINKYIIGECIFTTFLYRCVQNSILDLLNKETGDINLINKITFFLKAKHGEGDTNRKNFNIDFDEHQPSECQDSDLSEFDLKADQWPVYKIIHKAIEHLEPLEKKVIANFWRINIEKEQTLFLTTQEICKRLNISSYRERKIRLNAMDKMRDFIVKEGYYDGSIYDCYPLSISRKPQHKSVEEPPLRCLKMKREYNRKVDNKMIDLFINTMYTSKLENGSKNSALNQVS